MKIRVDGDVLDIEASGGQGRVVLSLESGPWLFTGSMSPNDANALAALLLTAVNQAHGTVPGADSGDGPKAA